jgi:hypothetical protein
MDAKNPLPSLSPPLAASLFTAPTKELVLLNATSPLPWLLLMPTLDVLLDSPLPAQLEDPLELPMTALPLPSLSLPLSFWLLPLFSSKF